MKDSYKIHLEIKKKSPRVSALWVKRTAAAMLAALGWKKVVVGILMVGDPEMNRLNNKYLGHNEPTDVISFSQLEGQKLASDPQEAPL